MQNRLSVLFALAAALSLSSPTRADPPSHFLLGAYPGSGGDREQAVEAFEQKIGHTISIVDHYQKFDAMPSRGVTDDIAAGRSPMISWTSNTVNGGNAHALDILAGKYDAQINLQAREIALLGGTVLLRWQPEMTDNKRNEEFFAGVSLNQQGPTYVSVWQHIHRLFTRKDATNVQWVWAPGGNAYILRHGVFPCATYFPGKNFVDWMGMDTYNKSDTPEAYDANPDFLAFYALAPMLAPGKPLIHTQTGATHTTDAQREWIATAQTSLKTEFPLVRGFVWFNVDTKKSQDGSSRQYSLEGAGLDAFSAMAGDPYFQ